MQQEKPSFHEFVMVSIVAAFLIFVILKLVFL
jgi:hypothetical protein